MAHIMLDPSFITSNEALIMRQRLRHKEGEFFAIRLWLWAIHCRRSNGLLTPEESTPEFLKSVTMWTGSGQRLLDALLETRLLVPRRRGYYLRGWSRNHEFFRKAERSKMRSKIARLRAKKRLQEVLSELGREPGFAPGFEPGDEPGDERGHEHPILSCPILSDPSLADPVSSSQVTPPPRLTPEDVLAWARQVGLRAVLGAQPRTLVAKLRPTHQELQDALQAMREAGSTPRYPLAYVIAVVADRRSQRDTHPRHRDAPVTSSKATDAEKAFRAELKELAYAIDPDWMEPTLSATRALLEGVSLGVGKAGLEEAIRRAGSPRGLSAKDSWERVLEQFSADGKDRSIEPASPAKAGG